MSVSAPPRLDAGNLQGFAVGHANYKGVSGANWGEDKGEGVQIPTDWRSRGANGSFDGLAEGDGVLCRSDYLRHPRLADITDGTSHTFLLGEDVPELNRWLSWPYANNTYGTCAIARTEKERDLAITNAAFPQGLLRHCACVILVVLLHIRQ